MGMKLKKRSHIILNKQDVVRTWQVTFLSPISTIKLVFKEVPGTTKRI